MAQEKVTGQGQMYRCTSSGYEYDIFTATRNVSQSEHPAARTVRSHVLFISFSLFQLIISRLFIKLFRDVVDFFMNLRLVCYSRHKRVIFFSHFQRWQIIDTRKLVIIINAPLRV